MLCCVYLRRSKSDRNVCVCFSLSRHFPGEIFHKYIYIDIDSPHYEHNIFGHHWVYFFSWITDRCENSPYRTANGICQLFRGCDRIDQIENRIKYILLYWYTEIDNYFDCVCDLIWEWESVQFIARCLRIQKIIILYTKICV